MSGLTEAFFVLGPEIILRFELQCPVLLGSAIGTSLRQQRSLFVTCLWLELLRYLSQNKGAVKGVGPEGLPVTAVVLITRSFEEAPGRGSASAYFDVTPPLYALGSGLISSAGRYPS